jgi:serine/threonine-protein phosphatase PGAM5
MKHLTWVLLASALVVAGVASAAEAPPAPGTHVLYLIRHGYYDSKDPADARVGKHLDDLGREQARLVAGRLASLGVTFAGVRTSTYTRAMETGDIIGKALGLAVTRDSLLSECTPPTSRADIRHDTPGEADSAQTQLNAAWAEYAKPSHAGDTHEILVCHGNVIRWFVTRALGADTRQWGQMDIANGSVTIITIKPDGNTRLVVFSDVGHLPLDKQTWAGKGPGWTTAKVAR